MADIRPPGLYWIWFDNVWNVADWDGDLWDVLISADEGPDAGNDDDVIVGPHIGPRDAPKNKPVFQPEEGSNA